MAGEDQRMGLRFQAEKPQPQHGTVDQIERRPPFGVDRGSYPSVAFGRRERGEVLHGNIDIGGGCESDPLAARGESGAQRLVTSDQIL